MSKKTKSSEMNYCAGACLYQPPPPPAPPPAPPDRTKLAAAIWYVMIVVGSMAYGFGLAAGWFKAPELFAALIAVPVIVGGVLGLVQLLFWVLDNK